MPRADFTDEFSANAGRSNFPKLKLQTNERARVAIVTKPNVEYVHWLEAPKIVNMAPAYKKIKDRDNNEQWVVETRFVNRAICHGDFEVLRERGVDDKACQACQMSRDQPDLFSPPNARYAATLIRYNMRPGGGWNDLAQPFGIGSMIWAFSVKVFNKLRSITQMGDAYADLRMVDLLLECTDQNYQKPYSQGEFMPIAPAAWLASEGHRNYTMQYLQQNCATDEDLNAAIGREVKPDWLADDLLRITQAWDVVRAYEARQQGGPSLGQGFGVETFQQGMASVQQQFGQPPAAQVSVPSPSNNQPLWEPQWQQPAQPSAPSSAALPSTPSRESPAQPVTEVQAPSAPPAPVPATQPEASPALIPDGLAGLQEFVKTTTQNPAPAPPPPASSVSFEDLKHAVVAQSLPGSPAPDAGKPAYSFDDLKRMAEGR